MPTSSNVGANRALTELSIFPQGYDVQNFTEFQGSALVHASPKAIEGRLVSFRQELEGGTEPVFVSVGENCGPATKMRNFGAPSMGSSFFDNIVISISDAADLIHHGFSDLLALRALTIDQWESHDSVFDTGSRTFFHHEFYVRNAEKRYPDGRRQINDADLPYFYASVCAKYEYLAEKFRLLLSYPYRKKYMVVRLVNGDLPAVEPLVSLELALKNLGASNFAIHIVHSTQVDVDQIRSVAPPFAVHRIDEVEDRWGSNYQWKLFVKEALQLSALKQSL